MRDKIKQSFCSFLKHLTCPILLFHATYQSLPKNLNQKCHNVEPDNFYLIVKWLKDNFDICFVDDLFNSQSIKNKAAITFDDGYISVLGEAIPILIELKIPSTIYLNCSSLTNETFWRDKIRYILNNDLASSFVRYLKCFDYDFVDSIDENNLYDLTKTRRINSLWINKRLDEYLNKQNAVNETKSDFFCVTEMRDLLNHPLVRYGNHTYQHVVLSSLEECEQRNEIVSNHEKLESITTNVSKVFSIPFGGIEHINKSTLKILNQSGYTGLLFTYNTVNFTVRKTYANLKFADRLIVPNSLDGFKYNLLKGFMRPVKYNREFKIISSYEKKHYRQ